MTSADTIMRLRIPDRRCVWCRKLFSPTLRVQGGGRIQRFCSNKCAQRRAYTVKKYDSKPENKKKKALRQKKSGAIWRQKRSREYRLWASARRNAIEKNLPFTIQPGDIQIPQICPLLGIPLSKARGLDFFPSVDRLDSQKGYTPDNIWVISFRANTAKNNLTLSELKTLVENLEDAITQQKIQRP